MPTGSTNQLDIETYQSAEGLYLVFRGRIVLDECDRVRKNELLLINKGLPEVVLDLQGVDFIDSAGLGLLVGFKMAASKHKVRITVSQPSKQVQDLLYVSKLDGIFSIVSGPQAEALKNNLAKAEFRSRSGFSAPSSEKESSISAAGVSADWIGSKLDSAFADTSSNSSRMGDNSGVSKGRQSKEEIEAHCRKAVEFMRQGNYDASIQEYESALAIDGEYLPALNNLAIVYEKQPSWAPKAIEVWQKVLQLSEQRGDQKHIDRAQRHLASLRKMQR
jgi:anti-sigma B factor antagonist